MSIISNTTVISNFASIEQMHLLYQVHNRIHISVQVYEEIQTDLEEGYVFYTDIKQSIYPFSETVWIHMTSLTKKQQIQFV